jgi:RimJ/RimL family protein N-acetyltransferase
MKLKTQRLVIRNFVSNDYKDLYEYLSDKETYKYEPGEPITLEKAKDVCIERSKNNDFLAIELENKIIGHIYFSQIEPKNLKTWEMGYIFNKKFHGKGFATEAAKAIIENGFFEKDVHKIIAHCNPKNISSWKLLERIKMKREGKLRKNIYFIEDKNGEPIWQDTYEYGILKDDI